MAELGLFDRLSVRNVTGPPRLIRETPEPTAECPSCGARMTLGAEGSTWTVHSPRDVADRLVLQLGGLEREELLVLLLNTRNVVMGQTTVYLGNVSLTLVRIGELFTAAVRRGAPRILLVHNHPSGDPTPSADDLALTANAIAAGRLLDIEVLDHIVVGRNSWVSVRDRGVTFGCPGAHQPGS
ncbi:MAG: JAB domain-containing protein [Isosphaeraceae bacterium]|nr:JAB domain-containing protein [Isosphaeraceae bacterium]